MALTNEAEICPSVTRKRRQVRREEPTCPLPPGVTLHPMHGGMPKSRFGSLFSGIALDFVYGKTSGL